MTKTKLLNQLLGIIQQKTQTETKKNKQTYTWAISQGKPRHKLTTSITCFSFVNKLLWYGREDWDLFDKEYILDLILPKCFMRVTTRWALFHFTCKGSLSKSFVRYLNYFRPMWYHLMHQNNLIHLFHCVCNNIERVETLKAYSINCNASKDWEDGGNCLLTMWSWKPFSGKCEITEVPVMSSDFWNLQLTRGNVKPFMYIYIIIFNEKGKRAHFQSWLHDTLWIIKNLT